MKDREDKYKSYNDKGYVIIYLPPLLISYLITFLNHRKCNSSSFFIYLMNPNSHYITNCNDIHWVLHKSVSKFGNMNKPILSDTNINKCSKIYYITYSPLHFHTLF